MAASVPKYCDTVWCIASSTTPCVVHLAKVPMGAGVGRRVTDVVSTVFVGAPYEVGTVVPVSSAQSAGSIRVVVYADHEPAADHVLPADVCARALNSPGRGLLPDGRFTILFDEVQNVYTGFQCSCGSSTFLNFPLEYAAGDIMPVHPCSIGLLVFADRFYSVADVHGKVRIWFIDA